MLRLLKEVQYAETRHAALQEQEEHNRQHTIDSKFTSKTHLKLDSSHDSAAESSERVTEKDGKTQQ